MTETFPPVSNRYLPEHCYRRGAKGFIVFDRAIPARLRPYAGRRSVKRSLGSSDPAFIEGALIDARREYSKIMADAVAAAEKEGHRVKRRATAVANYPRLSEADRVLVDEAGGVDRFLKTTEHLRGMVNMMQYVREVGEEAPEVVYTENGSYVPDGRDPVRRARREFDLDHAEAEDDAKEAEGVMAALGVPVERPAERSTRTGPLARKISLVDIACAYKDGDVDPATRDSLVAIAKQFNELHGSPDIRDLTSEHFAAYREALRDAPVQTQREVARKPFKEMLRLSRDLDLKKISQRTARKRLTYIKMLTAQALSVGIVSDDPFGKQKTLPLPKKGKKRNWKPFSTAELLAVKNLVDEKWQGRRKIDRAWAFYLLLYHGCRRSEICQLMVSDVDMGARTMSLINEHDDEGDTGDGVTRRSVKGESSRRTIPIHDKLIAMGFLEFVKRRRKDGHKRLFPSFTTDKHGKVGASLSANFRYLTRECLKIDDPLKVLHSLRGNWTDAARKAGANPEIRRAIAGRAMTDDSVENEYGAGYTVEHMREELNKIDPLSGLAD